MWCEHVCMYICTSRCILKSVCNLYIVEYEREIVLHSGLFELDAWKLFYCMFHCFAFSDDLIKTYKYKKGRVNESKGGVLLEIFKGISVFCVG